VELREEISRLKAERVSKETQISRLETTIAEKDDQLSELNIKFRQVGFHFKEHA